MFVIRMKLHIYFLGLFLVLLAGCGKTGVLISDLGIRKSHIPIFIEMPSNPLVFDDIAPLVYQSLHNHMLRVGYDLVDHPSKGYVLATKIKSLEPVNKLVSPDIVLFNYTVRIELDCSLLDFNGVVLTQKSFFLSSLISKPKNPTLNSDFLDFEYKRLFERSLPRVERFFRKYLLKAFIENPS